jgi:hypothetical protein
VQAAGVPACIPRGPFRCTSCLFASSHFGRFALCHVDQTFSSKRGTLLPLLRLFEDLLHECAPAVCLHLLRLELHPARVALPWILSGFASLLPAEQTLHLWDRIIGFDDLELLSVLGAAIFVYASHPRRARFMYRNHRTPRPRTPTPELVCHQCSFGRDVQGSPTYQARRPTIAGIARSGYCKPTSRHTQGDSLRMRLA